jgi:hypothetical protein
VRYTTVNLYQSVPTTCNQPVPIACNQHVPVSHHVPTNTNRYVTCICCISRMYAPCLYCNLCMYVTFLYCNLRTPSKKARVLTFLKLRPFLPLSHQPATCPNLYQSCTNQPVLSTMYINHSHNLYHYKCINYAHHNTS